MSPSGKSKVTQGQLGAGIRDYIQKAIERSLKHIAVADGASLACTRDATGAGSTLHITESSTFVEGKFIATIDDHKPYENIAPFGKCVTLGGKCQPQTPVPWVSQATVGVGLAKSTLMHTAMLPCQVGGIITITSPGQSSIVFRKIDAITLAQAQQLFDALESDDAIAWKYTRNGCFARAEQMSWEAERRGIEAEKIWIYGRTTGLGLGPVKWRYHVAMAVYVVDADGAIDLMVIDPVFDGAHGPISIKDWMELQTHAVATVDITNPDMYNPDPRLNVYRSDGSGRELELPVPPMNPDSREGILSQIQWDIQCFNSLEDLKLSTGEVQSTGWCTLNIPHPP